MNDEFMERISLSLVAMETQIKAIMAVSTHTHQNGCNKRTQATVNVGECVENQVLRVIDIKWPGGLTKQFFIHLNTDYVCSLEFAL